ADVDAVLAGQHQVEQEHVGPVVPELRQGTVAPGADPAVEDLLADDEREHPGQGGVVVHDEDAPLRPEVGRTVRPRARNARACHAPTPLISSGTGPTCTDP